MGSTVLPYESLITIAAIRYHAVPAQKMPSQPAMCVNVLLPVHTATSSSPNRISKVISHTWSYHRLAKVLLQLGERYGREVATGTRVVPWP
jgi:hypothetical protein